jgi:GAF domain-containing protein
MITLLLQSALTSITRVINSINQRANRIADTLGRRLFQGSPFAPREVGYIGGVNYLTVIRALTALSLFALPLLVSPSETPMTTQQMSIEGQALGRLWLSASLILVGEVFYRLGRLRSVGGDSSPSIWVYLVVLSDVVAVTFAYWSTGNLKSDFFLFYALPIMTAVEFFRMRFTMFVLGAILLSMLELLHRLGMRFDGALVVAFPRSMFLVLMTVAAGYFVKLQREQRRIGTVILKERDDLAEYSLALADLQDIRELAKTAIFRVGRTLSAEWVAVQLYAGFRTKPVFLLLEDGKDYADETEVSLRITRAKNSDPELGEFIVHDFVDQGDQIGSLVVKADPKFGFSETAAYFVQGIGKSLLYSVVRSRSVRGITEITQRTLQSDFEETIDRITKEVVETLGFEYTTISLRDEFRGVTETIAGRNVAPEMLRRRISMEADDILNRTIWSGTMLQYGEYQDFFDEAVWERNSHADYWRVWVPIKNGDVAIGVIEAGCLKENRTAVFRAEKLKALETLGQAVGAQLDNARSPEVLRLMADTAIRLIGADSATLHVFQVPDPERLRSEHVLTQGEVADLFRWNEPVLATAAGKFSPELTRKFTPRREGVGWGLVTARLANQSELDFRRVRPEDLSPELREMGVHEMLAIVIDLGLGSVGLLYVHYWNQSRRFESAEIELERAFANQMGVYIQVHQQIRRLSAAKARTQMWLDWMKVIPESTNQQNSEKLAKAILQLTGADNVSFYPYLHSEERFFTPVLVGYFLNRDMLESVIEPDHIVYRLLQRGLPEPYVLENVYCDQLFNLPRPRQELRFIQRERIVSCAILPFRSEWNPNAELFGIAFLNYRSLRTFSAEDLRNLRLVCQSTAIAVKAARYYGWQRESHRNLDNLQKIDQAIVNSANSADPQAITSAILDAALTMCDAAEIWRQDKDGRKWSALSGRRQPIPSTENCAITRAIASREFVRYQPPDDLASLLPGIGDGLAIPLLGADREVFGVMCVETGRPRQSDLRQTGEWHRPFFTEFQVQSLRTLAMQAVIAFNSVSLYERLQRQQKQAEALALVAKQIQGQNVRDALRTILSAITAPDGLGLRSAIVFVSTEESPLKGFDAVGTISALEALPTKLQGEILLSAVRNISIGESDEIDLFTARST